MEIVGILKVKFDTQRISDRMQKREFVVTTEANTPYPQHISVQVTQDKCTLLDKFNVGDEIKVNINLRGREWNGPQGIKYFNTIEAWRIEAINGGKAKADEKKADVTNNQNGTHDKSSSTPVFTGNVGDNDDLPF